MITMGENLFNKVWERHRVKTLASGQDQLFIGLHLIHEVTSPQAFHMIKERGLQLAYPSRTIATVDHIIPTDSVARPFKDVLAEKMMAALEKNVAEQQLQYLDFTSGKQGIVHVIGPELGITQPGMTIACGDSHTSTHGAFGSIAFGIGTSQVRDVFATQCLAMSKPKVRKIVVNGSLKTGVGAKDVILAIIAKLGVKGGIGYAYEYAGSVVENMSMEERMTMCNMSIEGGARVGYVNPDQTTFDYMNGREYAPSDDAWDNAMKYWTSISSDADASYDDIVEIDGSSIEPQVTWGINPGQACGVSEGFPAIDSFSSEFQATAQEAYDFTGFEPGSPIIGTKIDVAFIGSCTNSRISDLQEAAKIVQGKKISEHVKGIVVPGSMSVKKLAEEQGLDKIFTDAGFEWRGAGCSMCLGMNPDKLVGRQVCASSSNRNFKGRQGSPTGITMLMNPAMVAAAAVNGEIVDVREES